MPESPVVVVGACEDQANCTITSFVSKYATYTDAHYNKQEMTLQV
jgi:hypothetical protein